MSSISGYVTYIEYMSGNAKGDIENNHLFNSPFQLGDVKTGTYTSDRVVEALTAGTGNVLAWTPVVKGAFDNSGTVYDVKIIASDGTETYKYVNPADNKIYSSFSAPSTYTSEYSATSGDKVAYVYDNIIIPQNDLPVLKAEMKSIPLIAKARRIAVEKYAA